MKYEVTVRYRTGDTVAKTFWIVSDRLGSGDDELGRVLMRNFVYSLARGDEAPERIMLMNAGVKLALDGAGTVPDLRILVERGCAVKVCGTCLDYFRAVGGLAVGEVGDMAGSAAWLAGGPDVVTVA